MQKLPLATTLDIPSDYETPRMAFALAIDLAAAQAVQKYPDDAQRIKRAKSLILHGHVTLHEGYAEVKSGTQEGIIYRCNGECECEGAHRHEKGYRCSHRWAKSLYRKALATLNRLWCATYQEKPCFAYVMDSGAMAIFGTAPATRQCDIVRATSPTLALGGQCALIVAQAQRDGVLWEKFCTPQYDGK